MFLLYSFQPFALFSSPFQGNSIRILSFCLPYFSLHIIGKVKTGPKCLSIKQVVVLLLPPPLRIAYRGELFSDRDNLTMNLSSLFPLNMK